MTKAKREYVEQSRFSSVEEVASFLSVSMMTVYRLVSVGEIPAFRIGRSIRIPTKSVWNYLEKQRVARSVSA